LIDDGGMDLAYADGAAQLWRVRRDTHATDR
jgi:hypothetical protein